MKTFILLSFAILGLTRAMIVANSIPNGPVTFCGNRLNNAMKVFCSPDMKNAILNSGFNKRSSNFLDQLWSPYNDDYDYLPNYDSFVRNNLMYGSDIYRKRSTGTLTQECCKQSCSLRTLIEFCPN